MTDRYVVHVIHGLGKRDLFLTFDKEEAAKDKVKEWAEDETCVAATAYDRKEQKWIEKVKNQPRTLPSSST